MLHTLVGSNMIVNGSCESMGSWTGSYYDVPEWSGYAMYSAGGVNGGRCARVLEVGGYTRMNQVIYLLDNTLYYLNYYAKGGDEKTGCMRLYYPGTYYINSGWLEYSTTSWAQFTSIFQSTVAGSYTLQLVSDAGSGTGDSLYYDEISLYQVSAIPYSLGITSETIIQIYPGHDYINKLNISRTDARLKGGGLLSYRWSSYRDIQIPLSWLNASESSIINSWWESRAQIKFFVTSGAVTDVHSVMIMNKETPLNQYNEPHTDYFRGNILLEGY